MLKVSVSILLSFMILLQGLNIHLKDVIELESFLEHLEYHQSSYGDDLYSFVEKHYGSKMTAHDKEEHEKGKTHEKLPFKDQACHSTSSIMIISQAHNARALISDAIPSSQSFFYQENYSFLDQADIFQPPRFI